MQKPCNLIVYVFALFYDTTLKIGGKFPPLRGRKQRNKVFALFYDTTLKIGGKFPPLRGRKQRNKASQE
jgi:hypothetical protein